MDNVRNDILNQVVQREGKVLMLFSRRHEASGNLVPEKTDHFMTDPEGALALAECLSTMAFEADTGLKPVSETLKASLVQRHREILLPRLEAIVRSLREQKTTSHRQMAGKLLDAMFSEVFS